MYAQHILLVCVKQQYWNAAVLLDPMIWEKHVCIHKSVYDMDSPNTSVMQGIIGASLSLHIEDICSTGNKLYPFLSAYSIWPPSAQQSLQLCVSTLFLSYAEAWFPSFLLLLRHL